MKNLLILLISIALFSACRKDVTLCKNYTQRNPHESLIDPNSIDVPEFKAFLTQHPYLKPYEFNSDQYASVMKCNVFYKNLPVLMYQYVFSKNKSTNALFLTDTLHNYDLPLSTEPGISYSDAIKEAKRIMNFDHTCIFYSLGIYDINLHRAYDPNNFVLVWKIEGTKGYPLVILNANTKEVYSSEDGIIVN